MRASITLLKSSNMTLTGQSQSQTGSKFGQSFSSVSEPVRCFITETETQPESHQVSDRHFIRQNSAHSCLITELTNKTLTLLASSRSYLRLLFYLLTESDALLRFSVLLTPHFASLHFCSAPLQLIKFIKLTLAAVSMLALACPTS